MSMTHSDNVYTIAAEKILERITDDDREFDRELFNKEMELELLKEIDRLKSIIDNTCDKIVEEKTRRKLCKKK